MSADRFRPTANTSTGDRNENPRPEYSQGKAHVSNAKEAERRATEQARGGRGKPAPEGSTPGGVSS